MSFTIEPISLDWCESFHDALDAVAQERRYLGLLEAPSIERVVAFVRDNIQQGNPQFMAIAGGEVVGWCDILPTPTPVFRGVGRLGMGVRQAWRRKGVGRALLSIALSKAWARQFYRVELDVLANNDAAISFYQRAGFVLEGRKRGAYCRDGHYQDVLIMGMLRVDVARALAG
jgi:ribosomal protein S18 acetylase RimI-like enzyme